MKQSIILFSLVLLFSCQEDSDINLDPVDPVDSGIGPKGVIMGRIGRPVETGNDFIWGINGHPVTQEGYETSRVTFIDQINYLKNLGLTFYRFDVGVNADGSAAREGELLDLVDQADEHDIAILPMVYLVGLDFADTEAVSRQKGFNLGSGFANEYEGAFDYIELGNEQEIALLFPQCPTCGEPDGTATDHYDVEKFKVLAAFLEGMNFGIKQENSSIKTIINISAKTHYGFLELINDYRFEDRSINYDIIGMHWYSEMGDLTGSVPSYENVFSLLNDRFPAQDVWITEINRRSGSIDAATSSDHSFLEPFNRKEAEAFWINRYINQLEEIPTIKAFFTYELLEQPYNDDGICDFQPGCENSEQAYFGIIEFDNYAADPSKRTLQPGCYAIREHTRGYDDYVRALYVYFNKREPDLPGLIYWIQELRNMDSAPQDAVLLDFIDEFLRIEAYEEFIKSFFWELLNREGDPGGVSYWTDRLKTDLSREQVIAKFCSGTEFVGNASNEDYVNKLFKTLLKKESDGSAGYYVSRLQNGIEKEAVVIELINSDEYLKKFVTDKYRELMRRNIDDRLRDYLVDEMKFNDLSQQDIIDQFGISNIFWDQSIKEGAGK